MNDADRQIQTENGVCARPGGASAADSSAADSTPPSALAPRRPALRYHGGKWVLAPWIISHFPPHKAYVEPFGGAASVLLRKSPAYTEVYNDLDVEVVNFFRVVRHREKEKRLKHQLRATPFARVEFERAWEPVPEGLPAGDVERARRLVIRAFMGFSTIGVTGMVREVTRTGFRASCHREGVTPAHNWADYVLALDAFQERMEGVVIECRDAAEVIQQQDRDETLFYLDPPYMQETRGKRWQSEAYAHDMRRSDHEELAELLHDLDGMAVLSGYPSELYRDLYERYGWCRFERGARADGGRSRTECLWLNPAAQRRQPQRSLFGDT